MTDDFAIETKTWLRKSTYKPLYASARERGVTLGTVVSEICDDAVAARSRKRAYRKMTPELMQRYRELEAEGMPYSRIAAELGVSKSSLENHRAQLRRMQ